MCIILQKSNAKLQKLQFLRWKMRKIITQQDIYNCRETEYTLLHNYYPGRK